MLALHIRHSMVLVKTHICVYNLSREQPSRGAEVSNGRKKRITVRISRDSHEEFQRCLRALHLLGDRYLNAVLPGEIDELRTLRPNTPRMAKVLRKERESLPDKVRIAVTLDVSLVEEMNVVCRSKGIVRDAFIESVIRFLAFGDEWGESCISPLVKAAALLSEPRREFNYHNHPHADLHATEEEREEAGRFLRSLIHNRSNRESEADERTDTGTIDPHAE